MLAGSADLVQAMEVVRDLADQRVLFVGIVFVGWLFPVRLKRFA